MRTPLSSARALLALAAPLSATPALAPQDPFAPGERWRDPSGSAAPWIPRDVAFAGRGELVFAAPAVANPHVALYRSGALGLVEPLAADHGFAGALGVVRVAGGDAAGALFALAQYPAPDATERRSEVTRHDPFATLIGGALAPAWRHELGQGGGGNALLAADAAGSALVAALYQPAERRVRLDWLAPDGRLLLRTSVAGQGLAQLAVSDGAERVALVAGLDLWVLEKSGALLHHETLAATTRALALSGDGARLAIGAPSLVRVLADLGGGFELALKRAGGASEIPTRVALSRDARTAAVGWWNFKTGVAVRLEMFDAQSGTALGQHAQSASPLGPQNYPEAVAVTPDGARIAFGLWGSADASPEVLLFARGVAAPLLAVDLSGSVYSLALDASGTRVAVGIKAAHANQVASAGELLLFDTGERDVQVLASGAMPSALVLAARMPGAVVALFLIGAPASAPLALAGVAGLLALDPTRPIAARVAPVDAAGRAQLALSVPNAAALVGVDVGVQAAGLSSAGVALSATLAHPIVL